MRILDLKLESLKLHESLVGKIEVNVKGTLDSFHDLSLMYSPGVAEPCLEIAKDKNMVYKYTSKSNMVAIVSDGSAVLGLGNIGAYAAIPVMEGKAALFKKFANIDAFPICIDTNDPEKIIETVKLISPMFGGINLEDICAPQCFYVEEQLKKLLDIPVFHDDQHGTAVVCLAALKNALKLVHKKIENVKIVVNGVGSAGMAIVKLLVKFGAKNIVACDKNGEIFSGEITNINEFENLILERKNNNFTQGNLSDALSGADVFIGVSVGNIISKEMALSMNKDSIVFAMANPTPEISPELAKEAGVRVMCTGRSDYPNQVNNVLAFPGIFRGALDVRASAINEEMKIAAVNAISDLIDESELSETNIIPGAFDIRIVASVSKAVKEAAIKTGVSQI